MPIIIYLFVVPHGLPIAQIRWLRSSPSLVYIGREQSHKFLLQGLFKEIFFFSTADVISSLCSPQPPYPSVIGRLLPSPLPLRGMIHNQFRLGGSRPFLLHSLGVVIGRDSGSFAEWEGIVLC